MSETNLFYQYDKIIDREWVEQMRQVFSVIFTESQNLGTSLWMRNGFTLEGYGCLSFILKVSDNNQLDSFIKNIENETGMADWVQMSHYTMRDFPDAPNEFQNPARMEHNLYWAWRGGIFDLAIYNEELHQNLKIYPPVLLALDWKINQQLSKEWLTSIFRRGSWGELKYLYDEGNPNYIKWMERDYTDNRYIHFRRVFTEKLNLSIEDWYEVAPEIFITGKTIGMNSYTTQRHEEWLIDIVNRVYTDKD